ncbi:MAG: cryptochrome/photolyase family protein [Flavobacteriaceae bacterium]|nr:cryptochrome/photolyase family protein [Flavobacteriaceae bacterium]
MKQVHLIFPHQLFEELPLFELNVPIYLVEEYLYFKQYIFHKQKIAFHRATMKSYEAYLTEKGFDVIYIDSNCSISDVRDLIPELKRQGVHHISFIDPDDNWLQKHIEVSCLECQITRTIYDSPLFLNSKEELSDFFRRNKKKYFHTVFYKQQRQKMNILLNPDGKPEGGKWSFDAENRKKYPKKKTPPAIQFPDIDSYYLEAKNYVNLHFSDNIGSITDFKLYPTDFKSTQAWFKQFLEFRFAEFGTYEDAIVVEHSFLNHSVLSPMLNVGLITPQFIVANSLSYADKNNIPLNSIEGFIRQIIGWREFIRGMYENRGSDMRMMNYWGFNKKIPSSFYDGSTGIQPIDLIIKKVLKTGYCHHIERLMILGNFMMLCEFDPDEVYRWFMELFIDAYDWVMVPNIYGMSQFSDGGLMATKPYISSSNYILKMSDFQKGEWHTIWDGLFWRFLNKHREFFLSNPRLSMLIRTFDKMSIEKRALHLNRAEDYLKKIEV